MITGPLKWYTVAETIRAAVHADLTVTPQRSGVVPGAIAWDECDCGMLAVAQNRVYLSDAFPEPSTAPAGARCDAAWEVGEYVLQLIRCAPNPQGQSLAPEVVALDASAQEVMRDTYEVLKAMSETLCRMHDARDISDFQLLPLTSQGPEGGCVGVEVVFLIGLWRN
ncbi:hypothetical protein QNO07_09275 [Streptomyces sp. 549]|uniref:hypothetical protein n=1 Tax=Streptomyces sp. 549 TaxID=3049076 RepID=UPI0024C3C53B|nr:hypothetical protein [Streptomyces sp. 549]MDK1473609.1 hypothetical protein [Streptomyces sp. 549]